MISHRNKYHHMIPFVTVIASIFFPDREQDYRLIDDDYRRNQRTKLPCWTDFMIKFLSHLDVF